VSVLRVASMSADKLKELREQTLRDCAAEVQAVLDKHGCSFKPVPYLDADGRVRANLELVVK
jgi:hypothetical protein